MLVRIEIDFEHLLWSARTMTRDLLIASGHFALLPDLNLSLQPVTYIKPGFEPSIKPLKGKIENCVLHREQGLYWLFDTFWIPFPFALKSVYRRKAFRRALCRST
jgi:hypothetical protein